MVSGQWEGLGLVRVSCLRSTWCGLRVRVRVRARVLIVNATPNPGPNQLPALVMVRSSCVLRRSKSCVQSPLRSTKPRSRVELVTARARARAGDRARAGARARARIRARARLSWAARPAELQLRHAGMLRGADGLEAERELPTHQLCLLRPLKANTVGGHLLLPTLQPAQRVHALSPARGAYAETRVRVAAGTVGRGHRGRTCPC